MQFFKKTFETKYHNFECRDNFVIIALLHLEDKKVLYIPSHTFLHHLKWNKNEKDMGLKIKRVKFFFSKELRQNITNVLFLLFIFSSLLLCFWCLKKICNPSICTSNDIKIVIDLVKE
jgi:hypothetical protein